jgi:tetratricopeptide (TPR) repeat protein
VLIAQNDLAGALKEYEAKQGIISRLAVTDPSNTEWQHSLAVSYGDLATVYERLGRIADALGDLTKARDILAALVAIAPSNAQWKNDLAWFEQQIARLQDQARAQ